MSNLLNYVNVTLPTHMPENFTRDVIILIATILIMIGLLFVSGWISSSLFPILLWAAISVYSATQSVKVPVVKVHENVGGLVARGNDLYVKSEDSLTRIATIEAVNHKVRVTNLTRAGRGVVALQKEINAFKDNKNTKKENIDYDYFIETKKGRLYRVGVTVQSTPDDYHTIVRQYIKDNDNGGATYVDDNGDPLKQEEN